MATAVRRADVVQMAVPASPEVRLGACCGSVRWTRLMAAGWPYPSREALLERAGQAFDQLGADDWLEAFGAHARIGRPRADDARGSREQAGVRGASDADLAELAALNARYERRFGHVFLICASGLSATQMLAALRERIDNPPDTEFAIAAGEQRKITRLRLLDMDLA